MHKRILFFFVLFLSNPLLLFCGTDHLTEADTHYAIEEMLSYHVEFKEFSTQLAKRSFKLFFEHFDPYKIYLLQPEIAPFHEMTEAQLQSVVEAHQQGRYSHYQKAYKLIQSSILRARDHRKKIAKAFLEQGLILHKKEESDSSFAKTDSSLQNKIKKHLFHLIQFEQKQEGLTTLSQENLKKILLLLEKQYQEMENTFLSAEEHPLCLKILKAFAKSLDAHTAFFSQQEAYELRTNLEKQFEGVGIILKESIRGIVIKEVLDNSPAKKNGQINQGDILLAINNKSVGSASYSEVLEWLKKEKGDSLVLLLEKPSKEKISIKLQKEKMTVQKDLLHFTSLPYEDGIIGVIEVPSFYESDHGPDCEKDLKAALASLKVEGNLLGLILDMRRNSGGFLSQAVKVASLFVSSGVIVISKYAQGQMQYLRETNGKVSYQGPLVLLTSKMSASATEIVAQALQDYGLALVVGDERTFGKGTIQYQTVTEKGANAYFKVTVGRYYTVSGRSTQIEGVKADIFVPSIYAPFNIGEKYLSYALKNDRVPSAFIDPLIGMEGHKQSWLQNHYLPNLQKKLSYWTEMIPTLKINSEYRLKHDQNFLCFLEMLETDPAALEQKGFSLSTEDPQINEALHIIKDMSLLQKYKKTKDYIRK